MHQTKRKTMLLGMYVKVIKNNQPPLRKYQLSLVFANPDLKH